MSWDAYISQSLVGTGQVDRAAIYGLTGGDAWAASDKFSATEDERKDILEALNQTDATKRFTGFTVGGKKNDEDTANRYICINTPDDRFICARHAKDPAGKDESIGKEGLVATKTTQALIIAHHPAGVQTPDCFEAVRQLADYLIGVGY